MTNCERCRETVSAVVDGEEPPPDAVGLVHLRRCAACSAFARRVRRLRDSVATWDPPPARDLVPDVLAALPDRRGRPGPAGRPSCVPDDRLYTVGTASCGCGARCGCGCQDGVRCRCGVGDVA